MKKTFFWMSLLIVISISIFTVNCGDDDDDTIVTGDASLTLNGEGFHAGYTTQDDWVLTFDNVYLVVGVITMYQEGSTSNQRLNPHGDHPGDSHPTDGEHAHVADSFLMDLVPDQYITLADTISDVPVGDYIYIDYSIAKGATPSSVTTLSSDDLTSSGMNDYSFKIEGDATKSGETDVEFTIAFDFETQYECTLEEYQGDDGTVNPVVSVTDSKQGEFEITIHLDHLFGADGEAVDDSLDFQRMADIATGGSVELTPTNKHETEDSTLYTELLDATKTIGHAGGECHCHMLDL
jgi:hypothetical protein